MAAAWADAIIDNDAPLLSNTRGTVAFAAVCSQTFFCCCCVTPVPGQEYDERVQPPVAVNRTTQVFVNLNNSNWRLDKNLFVPFGVVIGEVGMKTFDNIFSGYGQEPDQVCAFQRDARLAHAPAAGCHIFAWLRLSLNQFSSVVLHKRGYVNVNSRTQLL